MLEIRELSSSYNNRDVLFDINLTVRPAEILAVIGPNGAGKSTLIRTISGVMNSFHGSVLAYDQFLLYLSPMQRARYIAVVPQARELPAAYTVFHTVLLGRTPYLNWLGHAGKSDHEMVQLAMQHTDLLELSNRRVGELSGGEKQRVLLARALAQDAPILLLDEPTTHLDLEHQSDLLNLIRHLVQEKDLSVLMVLHDLNLTALYADRVALLVEGRIYAIGTPEEVLTAENLTSVYHVPVNVSTHPDYGTPLILPDGRLGENIRRTN